MAVALGGAFTGGLTVGARFVCLVPSDLAAANVGTGGVAATVAGGAVAAA
jgi:hypothetical protein